MTAVYEMPASVDEDGSAGAEGRLSARRLQLHARLGERRAPLEHDPVNMFVIASLRTRVISASMTREL